MRSLPLTSAQIRAARALLRWTAKDLARESAVGVTTIRRAELADDETSMTAANDLAVRRALEWPALNSSTGTAAAPAYASPNASGRSPPGDGCRAKRSEPLRERVGDRFSITYRVRKSHAQQPYGRARDPL